MDEDNQITPIQSEQQSNQKEFKLEPEQELRFEVENEEKIQLELTNGLAEIFGTELMKGRKYIFLQGAKIGIYTYHGCTLIVYGNTDTCYVSKETPMIFYINIHGYLEKQRKEASSSNKNGPIVLLCGPKDVGKTTLSRILVNYAVRCGKTPILVDLDCGQGNIGIPGTVGCNLIERPADIETGFSEAAPIILHFGNKSPSSNTKLYTILISEIAKIVYDKMNEDTLIKNSGVIINTCGWITGGGYKLLLHTAKEFKVDIILTIDQEKLYNELNRDQPKFVKILFTPKSGGVVVKSDEHRRDQRDKRIREYFYGSKMKEVCGNTQFYPHSFDIPFNQLKIYKIGTPEIPNSCLPIGMKKGDHFTQLVQIQPSLTILNHILALTFSSDLNELIKCNVRGFICVTNVDTDRQIITVISPQPRPLPCNSVFLLSEIQFMDSH